MAYPSEGTVDAAIDSLLAVTTEDKTRPRARQLYRKVLELVALIEQVEPTTYADLWSDGAYSDDFDAA